MHILKKTQFYCKLNQVQYSANINLYATGNQKVCETHLIMIFSFLCLSGPESAMMLRRVYLCSQEYFPIPISNHGVQETINLYYKKYSKVS